MRGRVRLVSFAWSLTWRAVACPSWVEAVSGEGVMRRTAWVLDRTEATGERGIAAQDHGRQQRTALTFGLIVVRTPDQHIEALRSFQEAVRNAR